MNVISLECQNNIITGDCIFPGGILHVPDGVSDDVFQELFKKLFRILMELFPGRSPDVGWHGKIKCAEP